MLWGPLELSKLSPTEVYSQTLGPLMLRKLSTPELFPEPLGTTDVSKWCKLLKFFAPHKLRDVTLDVC